MITYLELGMPFTALSLATLIGALVVGMPIAIIGLVIHLLVGLSVSWGIIIVAPAAVFLVLSTIFFLISLGE